MIYALNLDGIGVRYVFVFWVGLRPFFRCYFGDELRQVADITDDDFVIRYKIKAFKTENELVVVGRREAHLYIPLAKIFRAFVRSFYQVIFPHSSTMGLFEYFVQLIRMSFLEPLEFELAKEGFYLVHGAVITMADESAVVLLAGSKGGKSTVSKIFEEYGYRVISDNYAFFNGTSVLTIPECRRYGCAKRLGFSFYGKGVYSSTEAATLSVSKLFRLKFASSFFMEAITPVAIQEFLAQTYLDEGEGCFNERRKIVEDNFLNLGCSESISSFNLNMIKDIDRTKLFLEVVLND